MKVLRAVLSVFFLCYVFSFASYAYYPTPYYVVNVNQTKIPDKAVYLELLVSKNDVVNQNNSNKVVWNFDKNNIITYDVEDFVSYTFYVIGSTEFTDLSDCEVYDNFVLCYFGENDDNILNFQEVKFAYLDKAGNVIAVTNSIKTNSIIPYYILELIKLDGTAATAKFHLLFQNYIFFGIIILIVILFGVLFRTKQKSKIYQRTVLHQSGDGSVIDPDKH